MRGVSVGVQASACQGEGEAQCFLALPNKVGDAMKKKRLHTKQEHEIQAFQRRVAARAAGPVLPAILRSPLPALLRLHTFRGHAT